MLALKGLGRMERQEDLPKFKCGNRSANKSSDKMPTSPLTWSSSTSRAAIAGLSCLRLLFRFRWEWDRSTGASEDMAVS